MPTRRHVFLTVLNLTLTLPVQAQHDLAEGHPVRSLHSRTGNSTDIQTTAKTGSTSTFLTALGTNGAIFAAQVIAFSLLRKHFKPIYEPRTYIPEDESKRSPGLGKSLFAWPWKILKADLGTVLYQNGVDAYLFVRFHRMMVLIFGPIWIVSWGVLLPVTAGGGGGNTGLDQFTFGNIGKQNQVRYWAHLSCAWVFTLWVCVVIYFEMLHFIETRQAYLTNAKHAASAQATTILITGVSDDYLDTRRLRELFSHLPGGVREVWINRDLKELPDVYKRRMKACDVLEKAETKLVGMAIKIHLQKQGEAGSGKKKRRRTEEDDDDFYSSDKERAVSSAEKLVPEKDRPKIQLPFGPFPFPVPLFSKKVDAIDWARDEIIETTRILNEGRHAIESRGRKRRRDSESQDEETYPMLNSAFIRFNQQAAAHLAVQSLVHHKPFKVTRKYIEVAPADVIWSSLGIKSKQMRIRTVISYSITVGLIIFWSIPVAFIGALSNISNLCKTYSWLAWLCTIPQFVLGIIQGVLPAALLKALMAMLPQILRLLAKFQGIPTQTGIELSLMARYFSFLVTHSFLVVTLSAGLIAALPGLLEHPTSIPALLAHELPQASTFFLTYTILHGLSGTGAGLLQVGYFIVYYLKRVMAGSTPRSLYNVSYCLKMVKFGKLFPGSTLLVVISIAYMVISPIINGLATATFFLLFEMYKYRFLYQLGQPAYTDTGGLFFPRAIQQIFIGVYIQEICLCALFSLARDERNKPSAIPQAILMLVLFVITIIYHGALTRKYNPLIRSLPPSKANELDNRTESFTRQNDRSCAWLWLGRHTGKFEPNVDKQSPNFDPPAFREIRPVWIPQPQKGLRLRIANDEVEENRSMKIPSGCHNAMMDKKGKVKVYGHPPEREGALW